MKHVMQPKKSPMIIFNFRIDVKTLDEFKEYCNNNDINISALMRRLIREKLKNKPASLLNKRVK